MPLFRDEVSGTFVIDKVFAVHSESKVRGHLKYERLFNVARAHLPSDVSHEFVIVDRYGLIPRAGLVTLCIRELAHAQRRKVLSMNPVQSWLGVNAEEKESMLRLYNAEPTMNPKEFFRENRGKWQDILRLWLTEGLDKDERIVDVLKASVLPLYGSPERWQPFNSHTVLITNSGTGKSFLNQIAGSVSSADISIAGMFGGNIENYSQQQIGLLNGSGWFMLDECEQLAKADYSKEIVLSLLSYMEQGKVERTLKVPVRCEGTKTIIFSSNPTSDDMLEAFLAFHSLMQGDADPTRFGRRIGIFLFGNDYKRIDANSPISALRDPVRRLIEIVVLKEKTRYSALLSRNLAWISKPCKAYENTIAAASKRCPDEKIARFLMGLSYASRRLRMAAVRIALLENLDAFVLKAGISRVQKVVEKERDSVFSRLVSANLQSLENLTVTDSGCRKMPDFVKMMKAKFPSLSLRRIADFTGYDYTSVSKILSGEDEKG